MKIPTRVVQVSVLVLVAGVAGFAMAQHGPGKHGRGPHGSRLFERVDANRDGKVTKDEYDNALSQRFAAADANRDGKLTEQEVYQAGLERYKQRVSQRFKMMDRDSDGSVTAQEVPRRIPPFAVLDRDGDGTIVRDDLRNLRREVRRGPG